MPRTNSIRNHELLTAALEGLELQRRRIDEQIREVRALLGKGQGARPANSGNSAQAPRGAGRLSPAARRRIAAAQKRRWAEYRKSAASKAG
jgi:hypothetical protein